MATLREISKMFPKIEPFLVKRIEISSERSDIEATRVGDIIKVYQTRDDDGNLFFLTIVEGIPRMMRDSSTKFEPANIMKVLYE